MSARTLILWILFVSVASGSSGEPIGRLLDEKTGLAKAVTVTDSALAHTAQFMAIDSEGRVVGPGDPVAQVLEILQRLESTFQSCQTDSSRAVKLDVCVKSHEVALKVRDFLERRFSGPNPPAVAFVESPLPHPDAEVAIDAVAVTDLEGGGDPLKLKRPDSDYGISGITHAGLLPKGPAVYISGQAEQGPLAVATRQTLESLEQTLKFVGLDLTRVVQIKSFLSPIAQANVVREEIDAFFGDVRTPPLVFVEWKSSLPIEIEWIAAGRREGDWAASLSPVEYLTPIGMEASPIFSRVAWVNSPSRIYVSGLTGDSGASAAEQIESIFGSLKALLESTGSDLRHLVKATYYVSDDAASAKLNEIRPRYYDPQRPPAASKAIVQGVAVEGCSVSVDMIAVPVPQ